MVQATQVVPGSLVFLEQNQVFQVYQLPLEVQDDQEALVAQGVPSCLDSRPLVYLGGRGDQGVQHPPSLHSVLGAQDPPEDL